MVLLTTREHTTFEVELLCHSGFAQIVSCCIDNTPLHHITILCWFDAANQQVSALQERGLTYYHLLQILTLNTLGVHHFLQREVGILRLELLQGHLIVVGLWVTQFCTRLRNLGQSSFHFHDILHLLGGHTLAEAKQLEHLDNVLLKGLSDIRCCLICIEIILFLTQRQTTLIDVQDILRGVLVVSSKTCIEELLFSVGSERQLDVQQLIVGLG